MVRDRLAAGYALVVGSSMIGIWGALYMTGELPGLEAVPYELGFHLLADGVTAITLLTAGLGLVFKRAWADRLFRVALGLLLYAVIEGTGYYAQLGELAMSAVFGSLVLLTIAVLASELLPSQERTDRLSGGSDLGA